MPQYILKGIVHPERTPISIGPIKPFKMIHLYSNKEIEIELNIVLNHITIWINVDEEWNIYDLRNTGRNFANIVCSILSFIHGYYYEIEIIQILSKEKNIDVVFGIDTPCISERPSKKEISKNFTNILNTTSGKHGIYFTRCYKDLNLALKDTEDTAFYCFRAIESLKQYCAEHFDITNEKDQWKKVSEISGYDQEYIAKIKTNANALRHGDYAISDEKDRIEFLTRTWNVVEKFITNLDSTCKLTE